MNAKQPPRPADDVRQTAFWWLFFLFPLFTGILQSQTVNGQADVEGPDCTGTVVSFQHSVTLDPHGDEVCSPKWITDRNSRFAKQILKTCPFGSRCHIEGVYSNRGIEQITKVERVQH